MAFKSYFDGGNQADTRQYMILTLAAFSGSGIQWDHFTEQWNIVLKRHRADFLHTTDALAMARPFTQKSGWKEAAVQAFIEDCVSVIERCSTTRRGDIFSFLGVRPVTVSVILNDFRKALETIPDLGSAEHLCVIYAAAHCTTWGLFNGYHKCQFFFDQGEPFCGHILDRKRNRTAKRAALEIRNITHVEQSDMRNVPALQAADLLAWAVNRRHEDGCSRYPWQERLLAIDREKELFDYSRLLRPNREHIGIVKSWKLPRRRPLA